MPKPPSITVYAPPELQATIADAAKRVGQSVSAYSLQAIVNRLKAEGAFPAKPQRTAPRPRE